MRREQHRLDIVLEVLHSVMMCLQPLSGVVAAVWSSPPRRPPTGTFVLCSHLMKMLRYFVFWAVRPCTILTLTSLWKVIHAGLASLVASASNASPLPCDHEPTCRRC
ncbi:unnamed protein product [Prorocentrum cordatum]|uniref:Secreted protein n=1 Tax=Prorocentrum cordatum TaxID=2364126 RepID=A0ABN9T1I7_9DINO|nr:unnamed protein product [Polarella glacialis]